MQKLLTAAALFLLFIVPALAQNKTPAPPAQLLTRTLTRHEVRRFGYGGTLTLVGAPRGSIIVEGWAKNEVDLTADIEVQAATEEDMARLAAVTGFVFDDDSNHLNLITTGIHDKTYLHKVDKKFPKTLLSMPWKIDYHLKVPIDTDLEINGGTTVINVKGVEGALRVNAPQAEVDLTLTGRMANVIVGAGRINFSVPARSWRGDGVDVQLAAGELNVQLPAGFSGDIDADVLRTGKVVNEYGVEGRERLSINEKSVHGRAGAGGPSLKFTVGDGEIHINKAP